MEIISRDGTNDPLHKRLRKAVEKRQRAYLWVPADAITFVPRVLPVIYGDGRALFTLTTINQRPAYWVIRACSTWGCDDDRMDAPGPDFGDMASNEILGDLEEAFGRGRCGHSNSSLFYPRRERIQFCQCEECADRYTARWPMVDDDCGCSWSRMDWPEGFGAVPNPRSQYGNLLPAIGGELPKRLRLSRAKGFRLPADAVSVARPGKWGNPFVVGRDGTAAECVDLYRRLLGGYVCLSGPAAVEAQHATRSAIISEWRELAGKRLACWCRYGQPCHADVLAETVAAIAKSVTGSQPQ